MYVLKEGFITAYDKESFARLLRERWSAMSEAERGPYEAMAREDGERYKQELGAQSAPSYVCGRDSM